MINANDLAKPCARSWDNMSQSEIRAYRKKNGLCRECGKEDAYTMCGRTRCAECAAKQAKQKSKARKDQDKRKRELEQHKNMQEKRKAQGLCPLCGRSVTGGYVRCEFCRARNRNYMRNYRNNPPRGEYGICWQCNKNPAIEGKRLCPECYEKKMVVWENLNRINHERKLKAKAGCATTEKSLRHNT